MSSRSCAFASSSRRSSRIEQVDDAIALGFDGAAAGIRAFGEAVGLVDEDDRGRDLSGAGEEAGDLLLALAIPFGEEIGGFGGDEIRLRLARRRLGKQGLAAPRWPI